MRTLSGELGAWIDSRSPAPRVYADANIPATLVSRMRHDLRWDVFFVMEEPDLRRAPDTEHFRLARQMHRTLVTFDRDYFDDVRFPPAQSSGVVVISAPDERQLTQVLRRVDRMLRGPADAPHVALPLEGRKVHAQPEVAQPRPRRRRRFRP
jgi:predicted nuclease of predicted toxin-antitoxin system